jgi:hypothetical protein
MLMVILFHACISSSALVLGRTDITNFEKIQSALVMTVLTGFVAVIVSGYIGSKEFSRKDKKGYLQES